MSWGKKIAVLYIGFVVMVISLVLWAMSKPIDLVTDNYYEKELKYQDDIDKINRTKNLPAGIKVTNSGETIEIKFPNKTDKVPGKDFIYFYRPSDPGKDFKVTVNEDSTGIQKISAVKLSKGLWKIMIKVSKGIRFLSP